MKAFPKPVYRWYKDGVLLRKELLNVMMLDPTVVQDTGFYHCDATNDMGTTVAPAKWLWVWGKGC